MTLIFVDVEAAGLSPVNGTMTEFGAVEFHSRRTFHGRLWRSEPDPDNPAKPVITGAPVDDLAAVMARFDRWIAEVSRSRPVFVSDNPAYDFQWINAAFDAALGRNPFGHSARRIGDFWAGLHRDFSRTQDWKRLRRTPHDHNPVHDALGNAEAFEAVLAEARGGADAGETGGG